jgi:hypothetical protein
VVTADTGEDSEVTADTGEDSEVTDTGEGSADMDGVNKSRMQLVCNDSVE